MIPRMRAALRNATPTANWTSQIYYPGFCPDNFWDTAVTWYTKDPDFTECFQRTVLIWAPCFFLWLCLPLQYFLLGSSPYRIQRSTWLSTAKIALSVLLTLLSLLEVFYVAHLMRVGGVESVADVLIVAPIIKAATFLITVGYIWTDKRHARPSSAMLFVFWFLLELATIISFRTRIRQYPDDGFSSASASERFHFVMDMFYLPLITVQFILSCFAERFPELTAGVEKPCPEQYSSFLNRLTFWWLTSLIFKGWKRALLRTDLWSLQQEDLSQTHCIRLAKFWGKEEALMRKSSEYVTSDPAASKRPYSYKPSLTKALFKTFWFALLCGAVLRLMNDLLVFIAPSLLKLLIQFVDDPSQEEWKGYLYSVAMMAGSLGQVFTLAHYFVLSQRTGMHIRSAVVAAIYKKALKMTSSAKRSSTLGEIVNLMAVDSQRFMDLMSHIQLLWSSPLQIAIALWMLWQEMGFATIAGLGATLLLIPFNAFIGSRSRTLHVAQMKQKDSRIKMMNEILNGMKILKLYAWEESFESQVLDVREQELRTLRKAAYLNSVMHFAMQLSPFIVALVTFTTFVLIDANNILTAEKAFVSLTLFNILRRPLALLPDVITAVIQANVSVQRVTKFLCHDELDPDAVRELGFGHPNAVEITDGTFSWGKDESPCLQNVNLTIKDGQLTAIVGQVGSGKTSLCAAMLGLLEKTSGDVGVKGTIAYVTQQAWIQNMTLRDNILFGKPFDERRYHKVIEACALQPDLAMLPGGDQTEIGEKGINLSGGQKQRVSLARAVYSGADVYFLDDPLSAVDAHVGKHIFEKVIGPSGILSHKTRILVTHGIGFLPRTDQIIVIDNGGISEFGTYKQLLHNNGAFAEFVRTYLVEEAETAEETDPDEAAVKQDILNEIGRERNGSIASLSSSLSKVRKVLRQESRPSIKEKLSEKHAANGAIPMAERKQSKAKLVAVEHTESGKVKAGIYILFLRHMTWPIVSMVFAFYILSNAANVSTNYWLSAWANDSKDAALVSDTSQRDYRLGVYGALGGLQGLFIFLSMITLAFGQLYASRKQHEGMLKRIMRAPMAFFDTTPLGRIVNRFSKDVDYVDTTIPQNFRMWLNCFFQVASTAFVIVFNQWQFIAVIIPLGVLYYVVQRFFIPTSRQLKRLESVSRSPIYSHFQESLTGASVIVAQRQIDRFILENERLMDVNNRSYYPSITAQRWLAVRVEVIGIAAVFFAGLFAVIGRDRGWGVEPEKTGMSISYALNVTQILNMMVRVASELEANIVSVERIQEYTEIEQEAPWVIESKRPDPAWPAAGHVAFNDYQTRYRPGLDLVLRGVSCDIGSGHKVGIVGRTGAGKSSLTMSLFRIIEAAGGSIVIDDHNIADMGLHDLRSRLTIIPQEPVLFSGTLRLNLDPFGAYQDEEVWRALENAHLKRFVSSLPNGLQHTVAEGGENLSVGQRQLICLARALLRKTKILILDEATAAVDLETDALIQNTIREKFGDCTVLTIAHRLNTIMDSTLIMVLDQGMVVEFAPPSALLADRNTIFYGLARSANLAPVGMITANACKSQLLRCSVQRSYLRNILDLESTLQLRCSWIVLSAVGNYFGRRICWIPSFGSMESISQGLQPKNGTSHPFPQGFCADYFWDLSVTWYTHNPDFTECFQKTVLVWVPCFFLWLMLPVKSYQASNGIYRIKRWTAVSTAKMAISLLLVCVSLSQFFFVAHVWRTRSLTEVPAVNFIEPMMKSVTFMITAVFVFIDKRRANPSSAILFVFWLLMFLTGVVRFRTVIESAVNKGIEDVFPFVLEVVYFPLVVAQFILACCAEHFPELQSGEKNPCPERFSSVPNRISLWWFTSLVYHGWRKPLTQANLWDVQPRDRTRVHSQRLETNWLHEVDRMHKSAPDFSTPETAKQRKKPYQPSLTKALFKSIWERFILTAFLRIVNDACVFVAPQVLKLLIGFVSDGTQESWKGYLYIGALFAGSFPQILLFNNYFYVSHITGMHMRSALINLVYQKALKLSNAAKRASTTGEIVNLMSVDSQIFSELIGRIQILWSAPIQICAAVFFLWQELGPSVLAGLLVMVCLIPINAIIIRKLKTLRIGNMKNKDSRIKMMTEILTGIKILKLYAWEESFEKQILDVRERELKTLFKSAYINAVSGFISILSPFMVAIVSFTTYVMVDSANVLTPEKAFVSLSLFNILRQPVNNLPDVITAVIQAQVSVGRLTKYFLNDELDPHNVQVVSDSTVTNALSIRSGTFAWETANNPCLVNINLDIPEGDLVAIVGQVGAGKSSLCAAGLGLMERVSGAVVRKGSVAYVSQQAWIQNLTLKDNILFGCEYNEELYKRVIEACALQPDLDLLPAGDMTEIGEKGINLSGGQKQRVSLARAVYSNADIYVLDDPLSAVDAHVGKHIYDKIIGNNGMLAGKTRILVTHGIGFLPRMDHIVVLTNGSISETGTYQQLLHRKGAFADFLTTYLTEEKHAEDDPDALIVKEQLIQEIGEKPALQRGLSQTSQSSMRKIKAALQKRESIENRRESVEKKALLENKEMPTKGPGVGGRGKGKLVEKEKSETGSVKWNVYMMYLKQVTFPVAMGVLVLHIFSNASAVGTNVWLGEWSEDSIQGRNSTAMRDFRLGIYGLLGAVQGAFILGSTFVLAYGQNLAARRQHEGMLKRIMRAPMAFFDTTPLGRIINRFSKDIDVIDGTIPMNFRMWMACFFNVISTVAVISFNTPAFLAVILPLGLLYYAIQRFYIPCNRQLKRLESVSRSPIYSHFQESLTGSTLIVATQSSERFVQQNERLMDYSNKSYFHTLASQRWLAIRVELLGLCITIFAALFAVIGRDKDWGIGPKNIGLSISYAMQVTSTLNWFVNISSNLEANIVSVERVKEYSEISVEAPWVIESNRPQPEWPVEGQVKFENYQTRYRPELGLVLKGIHCQIKGGEKVGIVGRTGAGKSSLTLALFRIIESSGGSIVIDDKDISLMGLHDLRSRLTIIPQEPVLFSGTLRMNLDPFQSYTDVELWNALDNSHLKGFVSTLPSGLEHIVAEGGENLSVGQRQLICLARALLRKTKILVLDEATAAIDMETDALIQQTIREKFAECTVLTIAHRLNTIMDSTRILVLDQGVVREFDSPDNLLQDQTSVFYGLARSANLIPTSGVIDSAERL
ncbi:uncharacterized protein LOC129594288 [Paramacrobiotus metropolitanus]|uniref:uncharacterized protein LOC129594288 n=1 Tax=Paramacrobiotus metropolitanus TaxID=2943436 RepID=UPI0024464834|nr:uncharacterized protein LOC129594288 [Paramacrobiotus metropolitanus]